MPEEIKKEEARVEVKAEEKKESKKKKRFKLPSWIGDLLKMAVPALLAAYGSYSESKNKTEAAYSALKDSVVELQEANNRHLEKIATLQGHVEALEIAMKDKDRRTEKPMMMAMSSNRPRHPEPVTVTSASNSTPDAAVMSNESPDAGTPYIYMPAIQVEPTTLEPTKSHQFKQLPNDLDGVVKQAALERQKQDN